MQLVTRILDRFLPALFLGVGVMLLAAGLLTYAPAGLANLAAPGTNGPAVAGGPLVSSEPDALPGSPTDTPGGATDPANQSDPADPTGAGDPSSPSDPTSPGNPADP